VDARIPIYDGHNDTLLSLRTAGRSFFQRSDEGHVDLPRAREGGLGGGLFAVWVPDPDTEPPGGREPDPAAATAPYHDEGTMPAPMPLSHAQRYALSEVADLYRLEAASDGQAKVVRSAAELRDCLLRGIFAMQLHFEGAEPIDRDFDALQVFHRAGLRSLGLVWSRPNDFAHGVPFKFPSSPDTGPGLTDAGRALVRACNELGIMLDLSHLNERGFWDVAAISDPPLVATHSGAHALSPSSRNLTDKQLAAIRDSEGMVGVNFHVGFLRADGVDDPDTPLATIADHVDYLVERLGVDKVGFGSDFDGAIPPAAIGDVTGLPRLLSALHEVGYDEEALAKLAYQNWIRVLRATWGR